MKTHRAADASINYLIGLFRLAQYYTHEHCNRGFNVAKITDFATHTHTNTNILNTQKHTYLYIGAYIRCTITNTILL